MEVSAIFSESLEAHFGSINKGKVCLIKRYGFTVVWAITWRIQKEMNRCALEGKVF